MLCRTLGLAFRVLLLAPPASLASAGGAGQALAGALAAAGYRTVIDPVLAAKQVRSLVDSLSVRHMLSQHVYRLSCRPY
jgi:hypothetical protein